MRFIHNDPSTAFFSKTRERIKKAKQIEHQLLLRSGLSPIDSLVVDDRHQVYQRDRLSSDLTLKVRIVHAVHTALGLKVLPSIKDLAKRTASLFNPLGLPFAKRLVVGRLVGFAFLKEPSVVRAAVLALQALDHIANQFFSTVTM